MAREDVSVTSAPGAYSDPVKLSMEDADTSNKNKATITTGEILEIHNTDGSSHNITISSADTRFNRTEDISSFSVDANTRYIWGPIDREGWDQGGGVLHFEADNSKVEFGIIDQKDKI